MGTTDGRENQRPLTATTESQTDPNGTYTDDSHYSSTCRFRRVNTTKVRK